MKNILKIYLSLFILLVAMSFGSAQAQTNMTKIKDATIAGTPVTPVNGAVLELESNSKGFLAPRMTTAQRDAIPAANRSDGLIIYNITTGCVNIWNAAQSLWLSLCGTPPPAKIGVVNCSDITVEGTYTQGQALTATNVIKMNVLVSEPGNYVVNATTNNGYYFEKSGNFPSTGTYTITIPGLGTPQNATANPGDLLNISFNGVKDSTCVKNVPIVAATVVYTMDCSNIQVLGSYKVGVPLTTNAKMVMELDFGNSNPGGFWSVSSNEVNGIKFMGSGNAPANAGVLNVVLQGTGTPTSSGTNAYTLTTNSTPTATCTVNVSTDAVSYSIDCSSASFKGTYTSGTALNSSNNVTINVNVTNPGSTTISTNTVNGMTFNSGVVNLTSTGVQTITLTGSGTPSQQGAAQFTFSGSPGATATCTASVTVAGQPVSFAMDCSGITLKGVYGPEQVMTSANKMSIPVNVSAVGPYTLKSDTLNGVSFAGSGTFTATGAQVIEIQASGTSIARGDFTYKITSNSSNGVTLCSKNINFVARKINVLGVGGFYGDPGSAEPTMTPRAILAHSANFSPTGTVPVEGINIVNGGIPYPYGSELKKFINNNKIDIIVVSYNFQFDPAAVNVLIDFVNNKKGVLIVSQRGTNALAEVLRLITAVGGGSPTSPSTSNGGYVSPMLSVSDPLLNGPFGDIRGKDLGTEGVSNFIFNTPSTMSVLATKTGDPNAALMIKHNTKGFVYLGDGFWAQGDATNTSKTQKPARHQGNLPATKVYSGDVEVYNSFLYANMMAWAINFVQNNTDVNYVIP